MQNKKILKNRLVPIRLSISVQNETPKVVSGIRSVQKFWVGLSGVRFNYSGLSIDKYVKMRDFL